MKFSLQVSYSTSSNIRSQLHFNLAKLAVEKLQNHQFEYTMHAFKSKSVNTIARLALTARLLFQYGIRLGYYSNMIGRYRSGPIILCSSTSRAAVCYIKTTGDESGTEKFNARRTILFYDSLNPLFCNVFAVVVVCVRSLLLWSIKSHNVDLSVFCLLLEVIEKFQAIKTVRFIIFLFRTFCTIRPWKFLEIKTFAQFICRRKDENMQCTF